MSKVGSMLACDGSAVLGIEGPNHGNLLATALTSKTDREA